MNTTLTSDFGPAEVPLGKVESELAHRLKQIQGPGEMPVHRARMSNLIVYCDDPAKAAQIEDCLPKVVCAHPARVLLLIADRGAESSEIQSSVEVRQAGQGAQLCSEQITLHAGSHASEHLPFAVRGLLIGDLPTNVWWAASTPPPLAGPILDNLAENAQQVVFDSLGWAEPHRGVAAMSTWLTRFERDGSDGRWRVASDLNWRRLKYWRRLLAQALSPAVNPQAIENITEIQIEHGPHAVTLAWQIAGWMASRLGWRIKAAKIKQGIEISFQIAAAYGSLKLRIDRLEDGPSTIRRIRVVSQVDGKSSALNFEAVDPVRLSVQTEGSDAAPRTITVQPMEIPEMVGRQLSDREPDSVFREAMAAAHLLANAVIHR